MTALLAQAAVFAVLVLLAHRLSWHEYARDLLKPAALCLRRGELPGALLCLRRGELAGALLCLLAGREQRRQLLFLLRRRADYRNRLARRVSRSVQYPVAPPERPARRTVTPPGLEGSSISMAEFTAMMRSWSAVARQSYSIPPPAFGKVPDPRRLNKVLNSGRVDFTHHVSYTGSSGPVSFDDLLDEMDGGA